MRSTSVLRTLLASHRTRGVALEFSGNAHIADVEGVDPKQADDRRWRGCAKEVPTRLRLARPSLASLRPRRELWRHVQELPRSAASSSRAARHSQSCCPQGIRGQSHGLSPTIALPLQLRTSSPAINRADMAWFQAASAGCRTGNHDQSRPPSPPSTRPILCEGSKAAGVCGRRTSDV